jgi:hypothetical protein
MHKTISSAMEVSLNGLGTAAKIRSSIKLPRVEVVRRNQGMGYLVNSEMTIVTKIARRDWSMPKPHCKSSRRMRWLGKKNSAHVPTSLVFISVQRWTLYKKRMLHTVSTLLRLHRQNIKSPKLLVSSR